MSSYELLFLKFPQMWLHPSWFEGSLRIKQIKIYYFLERGKLLNGVYNGSKFMNYLNLKYSQDIVIDIYLKNKKDMLRQLKNDDFLHSKNILKSFFRKNKKEWWIVCKLFIQNFLL